MVNVLDDIEQPPILVHAQPLEMNDEQFFRFCAANKDLRMERNRHGDILIMTPEGITSGVGNASLTWSLMDWSLRDGTGTVFGSSAGFTLPNRAVRSPDLAWVRNERLAALSDKDWERFAPICPDFVLELRSPSDSLAVLQDKMEEYLANGARLGWLLDPKTQRVFVYQPGEPPQELTDPEGLSGEPVLPGFVLNVRSIWNAMKRPR